MRYIFLLIIIAVSFGSFFMIVKPRYESLKQTRDEVTSYDASLETAEQLRRSREELVAKYNSIPKADIDALKTLLPDSVDNIRLIIQIDSIATKNGMSTLRNINYQKLEESAATGTASEGSADGTIAQSINAPYGDMTLSFQTSGSYSTFLAFLADLEHNLRLVDVVSVDFTGAEGSTGEAGQILGNNLSYQVTLKTYWLKK